MSDIIFKTKGKETFRIPFPTPGTKCPETKLEIKMTETDISKVLIEGEYATIMGIRYKRVEEPKSPVEEAYKDWCGEYPSGPPSEDARWDAFLNGYWATQPKAKPMNDVMDKLENKYKQAEDNLKPKTIRSIIDRWWTDTFTTHSYWDAEECMDDLADQIELWILRNKNDQR
jgi:hypothetical protein